MPRVGIITCEILELEFAYILATDRDVAGITVLALPPSEGFVAALRERGCGNVRCIPHLASWLPEPTDRLEVIVRVLELGLHRSKPILRRAVAVAAQEFRRYVDALLLGYGLCGNALEGAEELLDIDRPVFVPMDGDHPVDDCVGLLLGGRERYYAEQRRNAGTYFMTPGWTRHSSRLLGEGGAGADHQASKRMFAGYERCLAIHCPVMSREELRSGATSFAAALGLRVEECEGSLNILAQAWNSAKSRVMRASPVGSRTEGDPASDR